MRFFHLTGWRRDLAFTLLGSVLTVGVLGPFAWNQVKDERARTEEAEAARAQTEERDRARIEVLEYLVHLLTQTDPLVRTGNPDVK